MSFWRRQLVLLQACKGRGSGGDTNTIDMLCNLQGDVQGYCERVLLPKYILLPSDESLIEIIDGFERKFEFPNCGGAIDGTHIPVIAPQQHHPDYYNRKGHYSIVAQVMSDHEYKVMSMLRQVSYYPSGARRRICVL